MTIWIPLWLLSEICGRYYSFARDAKTYEIPNYFPVKENGELISELSAREELLTAIIDHATSSKPVEFAEDMYKVLLKYAQAFERYMPFKGMIGVPEFELPERPGSATSQDRIHDQVLEDSDYYRLICDHPVNRRLS